MPWNRNRPRCQAAQTPAIYSAQMSEGLTQAQIIERLERLERNVRMLAERTGIGFEDPAEEVDPEVVELAQSGKRMEAAKLYADRTGSDVLTAQRVVMGL